MQLTEDERFSVIIIGGGLGGLTAGAKLARAGKKVLLIERNQSLGGCARVVPGKRFSYELSLHELFGLEVGSRLRDVFSEFGLFESVELVRLPNFYRAVVGGADVTLPFGLDQAAAILRQAFPREERGIAHLFRLLPAINKEVNQWVKRGCNSRMLLPFYPLLYPRSVRYARETVGGYFDAVFSEEQIKLVLAALLPWYHDDPYATSLLDFAYGHSSCFMGGAYYPKGGSQKLSDELGRIILDHGGTILTGHSVREIITDNGRACGVVYSPTLEASGGASEAYTQRVIANAAVPHVAKDLLQPPFGGKLLEQVSKRRPSISFVSVQLRFRRSLAEIGNRAYSTVAGHARHRRLGKSSRRRGRAITRSRVLPLPITAS